MKKNLALAAALTSSLFFIPLLIAPASAGPSSSNLKSAFPTPSGAVQLVRDGGGGGGGGGGGNGGGNGGGTGGGEHSSGGPAMAPGHVSGSTMGHDRAGGATGKMNGGPGYAGVHKSGGNPQSANHRGDQFASHDDHGRDRHNGANHRGHGHLVGGLWVYDAGSYASNDCYWMQQRAIATGSRYWWNRYNGCAY